MDIENIRRRVKRGVLDSSEAENTRKSSLIVRGILICWNIFLVGISIVCALLKSWKFAAVFIGQLIITIPTMIYSPGLITQFQAIGEKGEIFWNSLKLQ